MQLTPSSPDESPDRTEGPRPYSYTQASTFSVCPRRYYYAYELEIRMPPPIVMIQGQIVHRVLEKAHKELILRAMPPLKDLLEYNEAEFKAVDDASLDSGDSLEKAHQESRKMVRVYYNGPYQDVVPLEAEVRFDTQISTEWGTRPICGVIDLVELPSRPTHVWDIKVSRRPWTAAEARTSAQLALYAAQKGTGKVGVIHLIRSGHAELVPVELTAAEIENGLAWLRDAIAGIEMCREKNFWPRTDRQNILCSPRYCGYYRICYAEA